MIAIVGTVSVCPSVVTFRCLRTGIINPRDCCPEQTPEGPAFTEPCCERVGVPTVVAPAVTSPTESLRAPVANAILLPDVGLAWSAAVSVSVTTQPRAGPWGEHLKRLTAILRI